MGDPADPDSVSEGLGFESAKEKVFTQTAVVFLLLPPESFQRAVSSFPVRASSEPLPKYFEISSAVLFQAMQSMKSVCLAASFGALLSTARVKLV